MEELNIQCKCGQIMNENDFRQHFSRCKEFKNNFKDFDNQFGELLKRYSEPKENLLILY